MANYNNNNNEELLGNYEEIREKPKIKIFPTGSLIFFWCGCRLIECITILKFFKLLLSINQAHKKLINFEIVKITTSRNVWICHLIKNLYLWNDSEWYDVNSVTFNISTKNLKATVKLSFKIFPEFL